MTLWLASVALLASGCASTGEEVKGAAFIPVDARGWTEARTTLVALRHTLPRAARTQTIRVVLDAPHGVHFEGRGALAVDPGRAIRMMLLGPAGRTALDVWITAERYRVAVPDLDIVEKEGGRPPRFPIEMFRGWYLGQLAGRLLAAGTMRGDHLWIVRDHDKTLDLRITPRDDAGQWRHVLRAHDASGDVRVAWSANTPTLDPVVGSRIDFERKDVGLKIAVTVEGVSEEPPDPDAFRAPEEIAR